MARSANIATACRILVNVGLTPEGVTSPGGFGGDSLALYAKVAGDTADTFQPTQFADLSALAGD